MSNSQRDSAKKQPARDAAIASLDRPVPAGVNAAGFGSDVVGRRAARARHPLYRAQSRRQLSRPARQPGELSRQRAAADAALPARGKRGRHRARLRQGHRQGDGGGGAFQCRADARHHGDLQRLVRPHADGRARRHRPGRCRQAPAVDRLDPHRARPGRAGARLHQMGRPAGLARSPRAKRSCAPAGSPIPRRAGRLTSISTPACRRKSSPSRSPPIDTAALHAARSRARRPPTPIAQAAELLRDAKHPVILAGRVSRDLDAWNARVALAERLSAQRRHRSQDRRRLPDRSSRCTPARPAAPCWRRKRPRPSAPPTSFSASIGSTSPARFKQVGGNIAAKVVQVSVDHHLHNGWSMDYQGLPPVDVFIACEPDAAVPALLDALGPGKPRAVATRAKEFFKPAGDKLTVDHLADCAAPSGRRTAVLAHPHFAVVERRELALPSSARLSRLRRRRRRRRRPRHFGRRRAGAQRLGPPAGRGLRRRRFHDGRAPRCGRRRITRSRC